MKNINELAEVAEKIITYDLHRAMRNSMTDSPMIAATIPPASLATSSCSASEVSK